MTTNIISNFLLLWALENLELMYFLRWLEPFWLAVYRYILLFFFVLNFTIFDLISLFSIEKSTFFSSFFGLNRQIIPSTNWLEQRRIPLINEFFINFLGTLRGRLFIHSTLSSLFYLVCDCFFLRIYQSIYHSEHDSSELLCLCELQISHQLTAIKLNTNYATTHTHNQFG